MAKISFRIPDAALLSVLKTGIHGAARLWLDNYNPRFEHDSTGTIIRLRLSPPPPAERPGFEVPAQCRVITLRTLARALATMAETLRDRHGAHLARYFGDIVAQSDERGCSADMEACDTALQVAVFGHVAYS